jgi:hypothetical protein
MHDANQAKKLPAHLAHAWWRKVEQNQQFDVHEGPCFFVDGRITDRQIVEIQIVDNKM